MIISHRYKFIFIKTEKTAGTSIEVFLSQHAGANDIVTPIVPHVAPHVARNYSSLGFHNHISGVEIRKLVSPEIWDGYFKFCVERNPWDKTLSHYHMKRYRSGETLTLEQYFDDKQFCLNYDKYTDSGGGLLVDQVVLFEELLEELQDIFGELGVPFEGDLGVRAKSEYRHDRRHYSDVLSVEQASIIANEFSKEIELHGYAYMDERQ